MAVGADAPDVEREKLVIFVEPGDWASIAAPLWAEDFRDQPVPFGDLAIGAYGEQLVFEQNGGFGVRTGRDLHLRGSGLGDPIGQGWIGGMGGRTAERESQGGRQAEGDSTEEPHAICHLPKRPLPQERF